MLTFVLILHISVCLLIIFLVLLQAGKATDMGSLLGGTKQSFFDNGGLFLRKATTIVAVFFVFTSLTIGYLNTNSYNQIIVNNIERNSTHSEDSIDNDFS